ncbi:MAG: hypothetical protein V4451_12375 [Pseudomonadota bacterium]
MSGKIDWAKDKRVVQKNLNGVDFAFDAVRNLEAISSVSWDNGGNWWDNRRLLADRACDLIQNVLAILKYGDEHPAYAGVIRELNKVKFCQEQASKKRRSSHFGSWLGTYKSQLSLLARKWKSLKLDLAFTHSDSAKTAEQRSTVLALYVKTPWALEKIVSLRREPK